MDNQKYHIALSILNETGTNQLVQITEEVYHADGRADQGEILLHSQYPFGSGATFIKKYGFVNYPCAIKYFNCNPDNQTSPESFLRRTDDSEWNGFVHECHQIKIQLWREFELVGEILLDKTGTCPIKTIERVSSNCSYKIETLSIPENNYGLIGIEFRKDYELFKIHSIYVDSNVIDKFAVIGQVERHI